MDGSPIREWKRFFSGFSCFKKSGVVTTLEESHLGDSVNAYSKIE